jgi:hypothetical protein
VGHFFLSSGTPKPSGKAGRINHVADLLWRETPARDLAGFCFPGRRCLMWGVALLQYPPSPTCCLRDAAVSHQATAPTFLRRPGRNPPKFGFLLLLHAVTLVDSESPFHVLSIPASLPSGRGAVPPAHLFDLDRVATGFC